MKNKVSILSFVKETVSKNPILGFGLFFSIIGSLSLAVSPPLVLEKIINTLTSGKEIIFLEVFLYFLLIALSGLFNTAKESLITVFGQKVTHHLRNGMCQKLNCLPSSYYIEKEPGVTVSLFVNDVNTLENLFSSGIISIAVDTCKLFAVLLILFFKNPGVAVLLFLVTPLLFGMTRIFQKQMLKAQLTNRLAVGITNQQIIDTTENIRSIRMLRQEDYMEERYGNAIDQSFKAQERSNFYDAIYSPILISVSALLIGIMMASAAQSGEIQHFFGMTAGTAAAIISYIGTFFDPLESIGMEIQNIQSSFAAMERIKDFLGEEEIRIPVSVKHNDESSSSVKKHHSDRKEWVKKSPATFPALSLSQISFRYAPKEPEILHNFSLSIKEGDSIILAGRTGAGKSTIIKLMAGLYTPDKGTVTIFGTDPTALPETEKRRWFGYVEQQFCPVPGTIAQQISLGDPSITEDQIVNVLKKVGLWNYVAKLPLGIDTPCTEKLFSQGQFQLLAIARAIVANPKILLLDEMTANLDGETEKQILSTLKNLSKHQTIVSVFHRMYDQEALEGAQIIQL